MTAWPNPANDFLHLEAEGIQFEAVLMDALGRMVTAPQTMDSNGNIAMIGLSRGIYFVLIRSEFGNTVIKVIKE